jgi:hypothetical protein
MPWLNVLVPFLREAQYQVSVENDRMLFRSWRRAVENLPTLRADILALETPSPGFEDKSLCIDVSVVDATRADMLQGSSAARLYAASVVKDGKRSKWGMPLTGGSSLCHSW